MNIHAHIISVIFLLLCPLTVTIRIQNRSGDYTRNMITGVGVNIVNIFWERLQYVLSEANDDTDNDSFIDGKNPKHSFLHLKSRGIDLVRFAASPYCQSQFSMWRTGGEQEAAYWSILDDIMNEAHQAGVRLIPTIIWRARMPSLSCQEPFGMVFQTEKPSCARSLIRLYATDVVSRYQNFDNIVAWELFNELNLEADIGHKAKRGGCYWDVHKKKNVCTPRKPDIAQANQLYNSSSPFLSKQQTNSMTTLAPQCLTTPRETSLVSHGCNCSGHKISNADGFSTQDMIHFFGEYTSWIRAADIKLKRPISSGHAMPRASSWHLAHAMEAAGKKWQADSSEQFCAHLLETNSHVELASIHPYIHTKPGTNGSSPSDEVVFRMNGREVKLFELVSSALRCIQQANRQYPSQLYIGEFGYKQGSNISLAFVRRVLNMVRINQQSPSPFLQAALPQTFDFNASEPTSNFEDISVLFPLITMWVWEFKPQHSGLSIEMERDGWLISEIAAANIDANKNKMRKK